jgi:hypothetical protein
LNASTANQYIEIGNFSENGTTPILYDFTNKLRLEAVVQNDTEKFLLPPSTLEHNMLLIANDTIGVIKKVDYLQLVHFTDFSNPQNQGNFIIITPSLFSHAIAPVIITWKITGSIKMRMGSRRLP